MPVSTKIAQRPGTSTLFFQVSCSERISNNPLKKGILNYLILVKYSLRNHYCYHCRKRALGNSPTNQRLSHNPKPIQIVDQATKHELAVPMAKVPYGGHSKRTNVLIFFGSTKAKLQSNQAAMNDCLPATCNRLADRAGVRPPRHVRIHGRIYGRISSRMLYTVLALHHKRILFACAQCIPLGVQMRIQTLMPKPRRSGGSGREPAAVGSANGGK